MNKYNNCQRNASKRLMLTISPQSKASLAAKHNLTMHQMSCKLTMFFKQLGSCVFKTIIPQ